MNKTRFWQRKLESYLKREQKSVGNFFRFFFLFFLGRYRRMWKRARGLFLPSFLPSAIWAAFFRSCNHRVVGHTLLSSAIKDTFRVVRVRGSQIWPGHREHYELDLRLPEKTLHRLKYCNFFLSIKMKHGSYLPYIQYVCELILFPVVLFPPSLAISTYIP